MAYAMKVQIVKKGRTLVLQMSYYIYVAKQPSKILGEIKHCGFRLAAWQYSLNTQGVGMGEGVCIYYSPGGINQCSWV